MYKTKATYFKCVLSCILCFMSFMSFSQTKSTDIKTINGKKYYIHKVEKGQSLYAIAKTYNLDVNSILAENDEAIDGLRSGQELKIPFESLLPKSEPSTQIDTNKYVYHKILKGETVYSLTKKYSIPEKKLLEYNPLISAGLKEGNYIIVGEKHKPTIKSTSSVNSFTYAVQQSETMYGISKKFNTTQDELLKLNPELKDGVKQGQVIKINFSKSNITLTPNVSINPIATLNEEVKDSIVHKPKKNTYTIGLLLPFKLIENDLINVDDLARANGRFPAAQDLSIDFYTGFKHAVDSLIDKDFEVSIKLFDTDDRDTAKIESICKSSEFKSLDAVFGPLYAGVFKSVARYSKKYSIPIISPVIQQNKILFENPQASKVTPSLYTLIESLADFTIDSMSNARVIIVNSTAKDQQYIKTFKAEYNNELKNRNRSIKDSIIEVKGIAGVKSAYAPDKKNIIVLLTNNQVYLQDFITQLNIFSEKKDITLMGFKSVSTIDNLDQDYLNNLKYHFATSDYIDYKDSLTLSLVKKYRSIYEADPSEYYFLGFDIAKYYLDHLKKYGPDFFFNLDKYPYDGVSTGFHFYHPDLETGFENTKTYIYRYSNYQLQKIKWK
jgi:LysM repeat protein/ABC-type branched-subunit amino acid transport system substrate-binding protein